MRYRLRPISTGIPVHGLSHLIGGDVVELFGAANSGFVQRHIFDTPFVLVHVKVRMLLCDQGTGSLNSHCTCAFVVLFPIAWAAVRVIASTLITTRMLRSTL